MVRADPAPVARTRAKRLSRSASSILRPTKSLLRAAPEEVDGIYVDSFYLNSRRSPPWGSAGRRDRSGPRSSPARHEVRVLLLQRLDGVLDGLDQHLFGGFSMPGV